MKLHFHGKLTDALGREMNLDMPPDCSVGDIRQRLLADNPDCAADLANGQALACVGDQFVCDERRVAAHEQVEFLPPVSGG